MVKIAYIHPAPADEDEAAAIAAAIAICTEPAATASESDATGKQSGWKSAALLEATLRAGRVIHPNELEENKGWKSHAVLSAVAIVLTAAALFLSGTACGAEESATSNARLKVALMLDAAKVDISLPDGGIVRDATTGDTLAELPAQSQWQITTRTPGKVTQICFSGRPGNVADPQTRIAFQPTYRPVGFTNRTTPAIPELMPLPAREEPKFSVPLQSSYVIIPNQTESGAVAVGGRMYRGVILIKPHPPAVGADLPLRPQQPPTSIDLLNDIDLEDYLLSVVPSEMPSSWPLEALKAQAIAARSYALANRGKHATEGYDIKATIDDQAYTGVCAEHPESNRAVHETRGITLTQNGKPISAFFHSSSGGFTELSEFVWSRPVPYLQAVPDYDDASPHFSWTRTIDVATAEQALAKSGKNIGSLLSLQPVSRGISPRVRWLLATGTDSVAFITGEEARKLFSLPSTNFNIGPAPDSYVFAGRGYGHGLGMSQWGAKKLAESGFTAAEILSYYYKDVMLNQF